MKEKKSCVITGATGYIGSHVLKHLLVNGWRIHVIADPKFGYENIKDVIANVDIYEYDGNVNALCDYFDKIKPIVVYHLAAAVITSYKPEQIPILIQSNIQFGTEILEAMKFSGTHLFVSTGSYWQNYNSDTYNPVDLYAATKEAFEKIIQYYVDAYGIRHANLRLFDIYGEDDKRPKLWNILKNAAGTEQIIDVSPGEQRLDMVHISDVCTAYEKAYEYLQENAGATNITFGVKTGCLLSLHELIKEFEKAIGKPILVNFGGKPYKDREVMKPFQAYNIIPGWEAKIDIKEGFKRFRHE